MRVVIDARIPDGRYGGVQQWVIGLAHGLSQLAGDPDEYLFLVDAHGAPWLEPYLGGNRRLLCPAPRTRPQAGEQGGPRSRAPRPLRSRLAARLGRGPVAPAAAAAEPDRPALPSNETAEESGAQVLHFPFQAAFRTSIPSVYQPWDLQHLHLPELFTPEQRESRELEYRSYCAQAGLVVVASDWVKGDLIEQYGIEPGRIAVVPVPAPTDAYDPPTAEERHEIREHFRLPERFVLYPAQAWHHKNHARLFEALRLLRAGGLTVPVVCTGYRNASQPALERLAVELGLDEQVTFLGFVAPVEIKVLYEQASALVFPSLYEGWGMPIVEAFSAGLPVACSNVTSLPELVDGAAIVFDPHDPAAIADALRCLWTDGALAADLARRGRAVAQRYDWRATASTMRDCYRQVAAPARVAENAAAATPLRPLPRITVIMAVRNGARTLQQALDSVFGQTYDQVEVVVVDGASTDGTQAILERNSARIAYWHSEPDGGVYEAWNKALDHATGDWICFLGSDDRMHSPLALGAIAGALATDEGRHRVAYGNMDKLRADGSLYWRDRRRWNRRRRAEFRQGEMIPHPATFHHRSLFQELGRFDERFVIAGDFEFLLRELLHRDPLYIPVHVVDMSVGGLSDRIANRSRAAKEVYRARHMHGVARAPAWCSRRLYRQLGRLWIAQHVSPRIARVRLLRARARP